MKPAFGIRIVTQSSEVVCPEAHRDVITSFEQASINNETILFSGSRDAQLKAWKVENG